MYETEQLILSYPLYKLKQALYKRKKQGIFLHSIVTGRLEMLLKIMIIQNIREKEKNVPKRIITKWYIAFPLI